MMRSRGGISDETDKINMIILDGKKTSNDIKDEIASEVKSIISVGGKAFSFICYFSRK